VRERLVGRVRLLTHSERMTDMKNGIPNFRSEEEDARFWETHNSTDYLSELELDNKTVFVRPEAALPPTASGHTLSPEI